MNTISLTHQVLMIQPVRFAFNAETAESNSFQQVTAQSNDTQEMALLEFEGLVNVLRQHKINVTIINDTPEPHTPDSIFPNNWISTHEDGRLVLYPMHAENRRKERREDVVELLKNKFNVAGIVDYSSFELESKFLEGTGSMVLDRKHKLCYACISPRTNLELLTQFCNDFGYKLIDFIANDKNGNPIYHTNVVMCVGEQFMVVCFDCIPNELHQRKIRNSTRKTIIEISYHQLQHFAGNMLELVNENQEHILVMSEQAYKSLTSSQVSQLSYFAKIAFSPLNTIESNGGGSARCMITELFLPQN